MPWYHVLTNLFNYKDCIEIVCCSTAVYYFSLWLKKDTQKQLLFSFYGYCTIIFAAHYFGLQTLSFFLLATTPIVGLLFIMFHQESLQKNFIALATINAAPAEQDADWLSTLMRACLVTINNNKAVLCVIEQNNSLATMLTSHMPLHTDIQKNVLSMILESQLYEQEKMMWITSRGTLRGINTQWNVSPHDIIIDHAITHRPLWQQEALFYTHKTDALVFASSPATRTFTLIAQGKIVEHMNAQHALATLKKFLNEHAHAQRGTTHEIQSQK